MARGAGLDSVFGPMAFGNPSSMTRGAGLDSVFGPMAFGLPVSMTCGAGLGSGTRAFRFPGSTTFPAAASCIFFLSDIFDFSPGSSESDDSPESVNVPFRKLSIKLTPAGFSSIGGGSIATCAIVLEDFGAEEGAVGLSGKFGKTSFSVGGADFDEGLCVRIPAGSLTALEYLNSCGTGLALPALWSRFSAFSLAIGRLGEGCRWSVEFFAWAADLVVRLSSSASAAKRLLEAASSLRTPCLRPRVKGFALSMTAPSLIRIRREAFASLEGNSVSFSSCSASEMSA